MSAKSPALSRSEDFLRPESCLSTIDKPEPHDGESKGEYSWRVIKHCVRDTVKLVKKADAKDVVIGHGVHHIRKINHVGPVLDMVYNRNSKDYITVDGEALNVFQADGRKKEVHPLEEPFNRLVHAPQPDLFIGWTVGNNQLHLLNSDYELQSTSNAMGPIYACVFNENVGEIVTIGPGFLTSWVFRYGGRHILPRRTTTEGLSDKDGFTRLVLEETASKSQKAFAASGTSVAVFNLSEGKLLFWKRELHVRAISAVVFFNPLKYLITAARDGSIKIWDENWHLQLVFVGHGACVTSLAIYPYGPNIMSTSLDSTIRVWSMETCDEVDKICTDDPPSRVGTLVNTDNFYTFSGQHGDLWKVRHIHTLHARIGHRVMTIKATDHPLCPIRNVLLCKDSSVRIMSPATGDILTTLLMDPRRQLVDAAYAIGEDIIFAVFSNGDIVKADTSTNPCTVRDEWTCTPEKRCNYLLVYEYVITADISNDTWAGMTRAVATGGIGGASTQANRTLLLGGRKDGHICVFNWESGKVEFEIEAHGTKGVLSMIANSKADQLISAGLDNIIKVWRLYPYAQESLAPLMSFYCAHTPVSMQVMRTKLAVAFQEHTTATYSIVMYNISLNTRHDHSPKEDHMDSITGLSVCNKMKLVASSSDDGTVRIWNEMNRLIRLMKLNAVPHSMSFCSLKGDLLVGIGDHIHKIDYKNYMPKPYRTKMISMQFPPPDEEKALPFKEKILHRMSREDVKRLKAARSSFKFTHFVDLLTEDENDELVREKKLREKAFKELDERNGMLAKIRDGKMEADKKPTPTAVTKREAFEKYLDIFYHRPKVKLPDHDEFYFEDCVKEIMEGPPDLEVKEQPFEPEPVQTGFFPGPSIAVKHAKTPRPETPPTEGEIPRCSSPEFIIRPDGYVPNSVLARLLWPQTCIEESRKAPAETRYVPPSLTAEQLEQLRNERKQNETHRKKMKPKFKKPIRTVKAFTDGDDRTLMLDLDDPEDEQTMAVQDREGSKESLAPSSGFLSRVHDVLSKTPPATVDKEPSTPSKSESHPGSADIAVVRQHVLKTRGLPDSLDDFESGKTQSSDSDGEQRRRSAVKNQLENAAAKKKVLAPKPREPLVKYPPPKPPAQELKRESIRAMPLNIPAVSRRREPSPPTPPPRPLTPLPDFITQFQAAGWFDKYFPNCNEKTLPKPWSVSAFIVMVCRVLKIAEYHHKVDILDALQSLLNQEDMRDTEPIYSAIYSVYEPHGHPPSCQDDDQKTFILKSLPLMQRMGTYDRAYCVELMVQFVEGDKDIRKLVNEVWKYSNLKDPHNYFAKELDSWDVWNLDEKDRARELRKMCNEWLDKWMTGFKIHIQDTIDKLKQGQGVRGRVSHRSTSSHSAASILKRPLVNAIAEEEGPSQVDSQLLTVTFDSAPDQSTLDSATYMEATSYFCDMELEKSADRLRAGGRPDLRDKKSDGYKNTVLVLPKIPGRAPALVRLGETHTSQCRPHRETALSVDLKLPPVTTRGRQLPPGQLYGFPPCINLPMKQVVMNPFPGMEDAYITGATYQQPVLLMLKTSQKYFVHQRSYVEQEAL